MKRLSEMAKPDISVITNIGDCHLENLGDREGVLRAKSEIFDFADQKGVAVLNGDDVLLQKLRTPCKRIFYGFGEGSKISCFVRSYESYGLWGGRAVLSLFGQSLEVETGLPGKHMVYNAMAAAVTGHELGLAAGEIQAGIKNVPALAGRAHLIQTGRWTVIDDCYNANPHSMMAALALLHTVDTRRVAILGDMLELGENEAKLHRQVLGYAREQGVSCVVCIGERMLAAAGQDTLCFKTKDDFLAEWKKIIREGDTVLVKASHGMGFDEIVRVLDE